MKKVLFSLIAMSILATTIISCQSNQKGTTESDADTVKTEPATETAVAKPDSTGVKNLDVSPDVAIKAPQFSSEDVNAIFAKFEPLKQEYKAAIKDKDDAKIKDLTKQYEKWVVEAASWANKLPQDENQIYIDHYTKLTNQWGKLRDQYKK